MRAGRSWNILCLVALPVLPVLLLRICSYETLYLRMEGGTNLCRRGGPGQHANIDMGGPYMGGTAMSGPYMGEHYCNQGWAEAEYSCLLVRSGAGS